MGSPGSDLESLRKAFCPPIDDAVFYAIASDYNHPENYDDLVGILNNLKEAAIAEENTAFDPSGTGDGTSQQYDHTNISRTTPDGTSTSNDLTSITSDFTDLRLNDSTNIGRHIERLSLEEQVQWLQGLFPSLLAEQIQNVLKTTSSPDHAIEELLNFSFLADDTDGFGYQELPKGIDGFAEEVVGSRRKGRRKKKGRMNDSSRASSTGSYLSDAPASPNVWNAAAGDVEFIGSKTTLQPQTVRSVYHANGASLPLTIRAFAEKEGAKWRKLAKVDEIPEQQIAVIKPDFPSVPDAHIYGLLVLTRNIPSAAYELLEAMTSAANIEAIPIGKVTGLAQYAPLDLEPKDQPLASTSDGSWITISYSNSKQVAATKNRDVGQAFEQASSAFKKSKSNHLYGGAAAYYSQVGHERLKIAKAFSVAQANTVVDSQSRGGALDLHGIDVQNAVRIAKFKTQQWWDSLGDAKYVSGGRDPAKGAGFRIVTGVGTHSKNHAPRIGPAVSKTLVNEGWKVEVLHGEVMVTGKQRR